MIVSSNPRSLLIRLRLLAAVALCLALLGLVAFGRWGHDPSPPASNLVNADCRSCHAAVWQEWESSYHARAWSDEMVQAAFQHFGFDRKCQSCHAPVPILAAGLLEAPQLRQTDLESGVNCLSCHAIADGSGVAARRTIASAPCRPQAIAGFDSSQACAGCHTAIFKDWNESRYRSEGKTCQSCHMPASEHRPAGRSHLCVGGHDDQLVRSGVQFECRQQAEKLLVMITNHATGHNFPGERHNRELFVDVLIRDTAGKITLARREMIKGITPFRGETSADKVRVDETVTLSFPAQTPGTAEVRLLYKRFPWLADRDALEVHRAEVQLRE